MKIKLHIARSFKKLSLLVLLIFALPLWGQESTFPVQIIPQATPPPPVYFSNYADASTINSPLRVQLILNDFSIPIREIRLKTYFQGRGINFQSNDLVTGATTLFLKGGVPLVLTNAELAPYFKFENITGISPNAYGNIIPEGSYQFCFEVFDVATGNRLSNKTCVTTVIFKNEPPFLVSPRNKTSIAETNPQHIVFQWTPRSINVTNVEYELSLVEIWDNKIDPQAAFLSSPPIFQTTTSSTTYVFGPSDPQLFSGKNYAWRVQAKAKQGTEEIGLFKNQGYSEIYAFSYATPCDLPSSIYHEVKGSSIANIFWDDFSTEVPEYTIRYRAKTASSSGNNSNTNPEWFYNKTSGNTTSLWDLKAGTTYEYQVEKKCAVTKSNWSMVKQFTTHIADNQESVYECGITPDFTLSNTDPLQTLAKGDVFTAGDFPVNILNVEGSNGRFTGTGYVTIPYLNSIKVSVLFTNVLINTDKQLAEGTVITYYDPSLKNILDVDAAIDTVKGVLEALGEPFEGTNDLDEIRINWELDPENDIKIEDGVLIITNPENGAQEKSPLGDDKVIIDAGGNVYHVDAAGNITTGGQIDPSGSVHTGNVTGVSRNGKLEALTAEGIQVTFIDNGIYGYDQMPSIAKDFEKLKKEYLTVPDADGSDYTLPHIAVQKDSSIVVKANVDIEANSAYSLSDLKFKTKSGELITPEINEADNTIDLSLKGRYTLENETIYAVVDSKQDSTKQLTAGAFTLWHLTNRTVDVVLVSVDGAPLPDQTAIKDIFKKGAVSLNIKTVSQNKEGNSISLNTETLGADNQLEIGDSPWLSNYNAEQKAVINNIKSQINYSSSTYYVLVFNNDFKTTKTIAGFMPLQRQFGFVFSDGLNTSEKGKNSLVGVTAHELGHGIFALQHPFKLYDTPDGKTDWLMDYGKHPDAVKLSHMEWAQIHHPALKFYVFQDEEDGEIAGRTWFTPAWEPFKIKNSITIRAKKESNKIKGTVPGFRLKNGIAYDAQYDDDGTFKGYFTETKGHENPYQLPTPDIKDNSSVYLYEHVPNKCAKIYLTSFGYVEKNKDNIQINEYNTSLTRVDITTNCIENLCEKGQEFYDSHKYLIKDKNESEEDALRRIAYLICSKDSDAIDYEVLVSQLNKDAFEPTKGLWKGGEIYKLSLAWETFWKRDNAFAIYLTALKKINQNIEKYNKQLGSNASKEDYYTALYYLDEEFLKTLNLESKQELLKLIFEHNFFITSSYFDYDKSDVSLIKKIVSTIDNNSIDTFLTDLATKEEYKAVAKSKREILFEVLNVIEFSKLQETKIDIKIEALRRMLDGNLLRLFNTNYENVIAKLLKSIGEKEATEFLNALEDINQGVDGEPMVYHLKERLGNFFSNDAYTEFFKQLNRLVASRAELEADTYGIVGDISWDVEHRDYVLVSYVRDRNNYKYTYNKNTHKVNIITCEKQDHNRGNCLNPTNLIPENSSPFDMVMIYFLKNVSPFSPMATNMIHDDRGTIEGKGYAVPILFLEHLKADISEQRLKNAAWNIFNITLTVATVGEGTAAISAVRVAAVSSRLSANSGRKILLRTLGKQFFPLFEFTYTIGTTGYQFGTGDNLPPEYEALNLFFTAKGAFDLIDGGLTGLAKLSQADIDIKKKVISELDIRGPTGKQITLDELDDLVYRTKTAVDNSQNDELIKAWREANASVLGSGKINLLNKLTNAKFNKFRNFIDGLADESNSLYRLNLLDDADLLKLAEDFDGLSSNLKRKFKQPNFIDGWLSISKRPQMRLDEDILDALFSLTTKHKNFVRTYSKELDNIFDKLGVARAGCKTCPNSNDIDLQVGYIKDIVKDLEGTLTKVGDDAQNLQKFLKEMGESSKKAKGGAFTLKTINNKWSELTEGGYSFVRFEGKIPDIETGHKLDLLFRNATKNRRRAIELKNWKKVTSIAADEKSQFYQYIKSKKEFRYYFNENTAEAKLAFQNIFKNPDVAEKLWDLNPELFKSLDSEIIKSSENLVQLAEKGTLVNYINWVR
ncbi:hypothetical protein FEZ18_09095 [Oceanihabitans sp. IOP_32]|uniref:hypothetical protein n=1 Tax=Oceanihabitans sp. IOP_32 TaxID=2529032 RepID=UPI0012938152|nr:hypothetical protein [Oceanihabitans sp. IOP_32]QFZ54943.1 hypothetical protein FEZ18_09095 [Oceanihabitans sp. IOP_32]